MTLTAYQLLSALALLQLSTNCIHAVPIKTCEQQSPCLDIQVAQVAGSTCLPAAECQFRACINLDTAAMGCMKDGGSLSHLCGEVGDTDDCVWNPVEYASGEDGDPPQITTDTQCQTGGPNEELTFVYKDGGGCGDTNRITVHPDGGRGSVSCDKSTEEFCTGGGNIGKECVWTVTLPACSSCPAITFDTPSLSTDVVENFCSTGSSIFNVPVYNSGGLEATYKYTQPDSGVSGTGVVMGGDVDIAVIPQGGQTTLNVELTLEDGAICQYSYDFDPDCSCEDSPEPTVMDPNDNCPSDQICCPLTSLCDEPGTNVAACGDPHMTGFLGQKFDFTGEDGGWYTLIADENMNVNMRVTSPVADLPEITYITGLSILTTDADGFDHSIVIEVTDPHNMDSSCPVGVSPCLADGSLRVVLDGEETLAGPGTVFLGAGVEVSAANLPGACRSFGFEKYWERKKLEYAAHARRLGDSMDMGVWILGDPTATNMAECEEYVARAEVEVGGLFAHQSEHASFQIVTPKAAIRLSHGRLHQVAMRDPTDQYDLPDHLTWQMNVAVDHNEVSSDAKGVLGETFVPTRDADGKPIMTGMEAIRGTQEDYRVAEALATRFF